MKKMTTALLTTLILGSLCAAAQNAGNLVVNGDFKQVESPKEETAWKPGYCFIHAPSVPNDAMRDEWKQVSKVVTVPEKANWLELVVRIDGIGELNFKDVQVYEQD